MSEKSNKTAKVGFEEMSFGDIAAGIQKNTDDIKEATIRVQDMQRNRNSLVRELEKRTRLLIDGIDTSTAADPAKRNGSESLRENILQTIAASPGTIKVSEIASKSGATKAYVGVIIPQLVKSGEVVRIGADGERLKSNSKKRAVAYAYNGSA